MLGRTRERGMEMIEWIKQNKGKVITAVTAVFTLAAGLGSTLLTPEQREAIVTFLTTVV